MRFIGLDVHLDFCEIAICENGRVRSAGRVPSSPAGIDILVRSLAADDQVALEATGNALQIARLLEPHVARVVVAPTKELAAITTAKVKTDRLDARKLARLLAAGLLTGCWLPDEDTRSLRRWLSRRAQLVRQRTRSKNEIHAVLMRNLKGRPPMSDVFGKGGREWLAALELPRDERHTVDGCLRQIDFVNGEIAILEREIAEHAIDSPEIRRLMTVPGVSLMTAATFMAAVGDIHRFRSPRRLVSYLGLDPKVRQSGSGQREDRPDLQARRRSGARDARRGGVRRGQHARPDARVLSTRQRPAREGDRDRRGRTQAGSAVLASADRREGLRVRAPVAHSAQAARAGAPRRRRAACR